MIRKTYSQQAFDLAGQINRASLPHADHFVLLRTSNGAAETLRPADAYWLDFTHKRDGRLIHTTGVFATNPRDAVKWLEGHLAAVAWNFGRN